MTCPVADASGITLDQARAPRSWQTPLVPRPASLARQGLAFAALLTAAASASGCWQPAYVRNRALHYVDGELVATPPPSPAAYEAYIRARLALERDPPQLDAARKHILEALRWQPDEPQLWTVRAEIEWKAADLAAAERALAKALQLRPNYPEAQRLLAEIHERGPASTRPIAATSPAER